MSYLTRLATQFQCLVHLALNTNHGADELFEEDPSFHISTMIMTRMKMFADDMASKAQTYAFLSSDTDVRENADDVYGDATQNGGLFGIRSEEDVEELQDILHPDLVLQYLKHGTIQNLLLTVFRNNRGFELGTFNATILATVMKKQSSKWTDLSLGFVSNIIVVVHRFITNAPPARITRSAKHSSTRCSMNSFSGIAKRLRTLVPCLKWRMVIFQ